MIAARVRILVADDIPAWRAQVRSLLAAFVEWEIVAEACDGVEAVRHATELRPDVAILDLGMPVLNGIAAAAQIRQQCPTCLVIFLTQNSDLAVMNAALAEGAHGYVIKGKAATDLVPAVSSALANR